MAEQDKGVEELLDRLNDRPFQKLEGSWRSLFESLERPALLPLPEQRYEFVRWKKARVNIDYHIDIGGHYTACPTPSRRNRSTPASPPPRSRSCTAADASPPTRSVSRRAATRPSPATAPRRTRSTSSGHPRASWSGPSRPGQPPPSWPGASWRADPIPSRATVPVSGSCDSGRSILTTASRPPRIERFASAASRTAP
jgi:hypothetical protein